jgi:NAD-dependent dihydropyrimidine dehydrogenase PreA subunit
MIYLKDVSSLKYDAGLCTGCGRCAEVCPRGVFLIQRGKAEITNMDKCIECGACMNNCADEAISVKPGVGCAAAMFDGLLKYGNMEKGSCACGSDSTTKSGCC